MKVLSFVIPAYNSQSFLDKCISSMLVPGCLDKLEIIVVNDGSVDSTAEIAGKYCIKYPDAVRLISQENRGHGGALNTGCAAAQGKYLKVVDADDWVETENLLRFVTYLEQCSSDVVLTHHRTLDIATGEVKNWKSYPPEFEAGYSFDKILADWKSFDRSLTFHGITYRTAFYRERGIALSEHVFYEDHEYAAYPCCHAAAVTPFDLFVYIYRIGDVNQSVSNANQLKRIGHTRTVLERMRKEYLALPAMPGKSYAARKIEGLMMSYLTTALLVEPDKKRGRSLAKREMECCRQDVPEIYAHLTRRYRIFCLLNRLYIGKAELDAVLKSKLYNKLRKNHDFT